MVQIQKSMVAIALRGVTVLPSMSVYLDMERNMSIAAAKTAQKQNAEIFLVAQKNARQESPAREDLERFGVIAAVRQIMTLPNNKVRVLVNGLEAAELVDITGYVPQLEAVVRTLPETEQTPERREAMCRILREETGRYLAARAGANRELKNLVELEYEFGRFLRQLSCNLPMSQPERQEYLGLCTDDEAAYDFLIRWLVKETDVEAFRKDYQNKVRHNLDQHQKEYILREQMKVIRDELGDGAGSDADRFEEQLKQLEAPEEVLQTISKEIKRLRSMSMGGPEVGVCQNYIETLLSMPWEKRDEETLSIPEARRILDEDHYGLKKVKEQVLEFLAVRKLKGDSAGQVLLLAGPPGTGKTSIARSVARALNRKYVRISLGGVHDEAEIRGHRRTYVAAMPGRIAAAIRKAGTKNPLMLFDELDKVGSDSYHGDPASALLEVLDREQNRNFADHYLEVPFDLSEVLFMATANTLQTIPKPLLDRMEVIEIGSYTSAEKLEIASRFLLPKQMERSGLPENVLEITGDALKAVIRDYTREAGVRGLERELETLCRKAALQYLEQDQKHIVIDEESLEAYLGKKKVRVEAANAKGEAGIVRGLAWTSAGGDTLQIEVATLPGKGALVLTGKMGDVMKESARIALSYVRSVASDYGVKSAFFEKNDLHLHIPEGAVPKDGPSAGITMATAILSAIADIPVRPDVAMTGEVTLRGRVLPIGGLKEKLLAAKAAGIRKVLVPAENRQDVAELEKEVTEGLSIVFVDRMEEVLSQAFMKTARNPGKKKGEKH